MSKTNRVARWTNYELFTFRDGIRWAWVTYEAEMPFGERYCVDVKEDTGRVSP
jgi:hypothetical protein